MKRGIALGVLAALMAALLALFCLLPGGSPLVGSWETELALDESQSVKLRYTFGPDGTYTCDLSVRGKGPSGNAQVRGNYKALGDRLYLSEGLDYAIDVAVYDHYRLSGDTLTLLDSSTGDLVGFYPLDLDRVEE